MRSENPQFAAYLESHFPTAPKNSGEKGPEEKSALEPELAPPLCRTDTSRLGVPAEISSLVRWTEGPRAVFDAAQIFPGWPAGERIDRYIYSGPGGLLWLRVDDVPQIAIASKEANGQRQIELRYHFTLGAGRFMEPLKRLARWRWLPAKRRQRFSTIVYYAIYYPVWWHLECAGTGHPLHAGAVVAGGEAVLIAGLPGSGKSTLASALLRSSQARLLSDNVVLHDGKRVWGCYEPLLLGSSDEEAAAGLDETGHEHAFDRIGYHAPHLDRPFAPKAAVIISRGEQTALEPIDGRRCARMLLAINEAAKEVRRYHVFSAVFSLAESRSPDCYRERERSLGELLDGLPCFRLHLREGAVEEGVAQLIKLCRSTKEKVSR